jgi:hypothetical protein
MGLWRILPYSGTDQFIGGTAILQWLNENISFHFHLGLMHFRWQLTSCDFLVTRFLSYLGIESHVQYCSFILYIYLHS